MVDRTAELDRLIGQRVRAARLMKNMTQKALAAAVGVSFQQVQKYEKGTNRVSASALLGISETLATDLLLFYEGLPRPAAAAIPIDLSKASAIDFEILRGVMNIRDSKAKRCIADLVAVVEAGALTSKR